MLQPGTVVHAKEIRTISGYVLDNTTRSIRIRSGEAQAQVLTVYNSPKGSLTIRKIDALTEQPLSGAEFRITTVNGEPVDISEGQTSSNGIYRTDNNGLIVLSRIQPGTYTVSEIKASSGYVLDSAAQTVTVRANDAQTITFRNAPKQTLTLQKYVRGSTEPLAGVSFHVTDQNNSPVGASNGDYVTDRSGQIVIRDLTPGTTITAVETETASGYVLDSAPQSILIQSGEAQKMVFYNTPKGSLSINKVDGRTEAPLSGVEFKITTALGEAVADNEGQTDSNGIFRTDENGRIGF